MNDTFAKAKLNTRVSIQANKLDLATSYVARLQHFTATCTIVSITVTTATIALWLKHRIKHIKQGSLLVQQKSSQLCVTLESLQILQLPPPLKWCSDIYPCFFLWHGPILLFTLLFFVGVLSSSLWCGQWWGILWLCCCLFSAIVYSWGMNVSDQVRHPSIYFLHCMNVLYPLQDHVGLRLSQNTSGERYALDRLSV